MPFKGWMDVAWRDVITDDIVKTKDDAQWIVRAPWNGTHVMLAKEVGGSLRRTFGPIVPVPLADGDKLVQVLRPLAPVGTPSVHDSAPRFGQPAAPTWGDHDPGPPADRDFLVPLPTTDGVPNFKDAMTPAERKAQLAPADPMTPGMPDPCQPIGCDNGIHRPGCTFAETDAKPVHTAAKVDVRAIADTIEAATEQVKAIRDGLPRFGAPDPVTGTRSAVMLLPTVTAAERLDGPDPDDEGKAVAELVRAGLEPQLIAVVQDGEILVPRELDDMALRSHLFLMHGKFFNEQDVERETLAVHHREAHAGVVGHRHVQRDKLQP